MPEDNGDPLNPASAVYAGKAVRYQCPACKTSYEFRERLSEPPNCGECLFERVQVVPLVPVEEPDEPLVVEREQEIPF